MLLLLLFCMIFLKTRFYIPTRLIYDSIINTINYDQKYICNQNVIGLKLTSLVCHESFFISVVFHEWKSHSSHLFQYTVGYSIQVRGHIEPNVVFFLAKFIGGFPSPLPRVLITTVINSFTTDTYVTHRIWCSRGFNKIIAHAPFFSNLCGRHSCVSRCNYCYYVTRAHMYIPTE